MALPLTLFEAKTPPKPVLDASKSAEVVEDAALLTVALTCSLLSAVTLRSPPSLVTITPLT